MFKDLTILTRALMAAADTHIALFQWRPAADVYRTPNGWLVKLELAGVRPEEIEVSIRGCILMVCGRRRDCLLEEREQCYSLEISYTNFQRQFELPCDFEHARVASEYRDGMLLIRIDTEGRTHE